MRRTAAGLLSVAAILASGCGTSRAYPRRDVPITRPSTNPFPVADDGSTAALGEDAESESRHFARENVPDSVMVPDQFQGGYQDGPISPY